ncbi:MAG: ferrous iron transport protein A [Gemmatimonadota bacterium]|nr:ferrous iron transport protein A [Gemmatimonadota bacterium]
MNPVTWLRNGLGALVPRVWGKECPRGTPVPAPGPCADCDSVSLVDLAVRERARVSCLEDPGSAASIRLASAGVLPGTTVRLVQRRPVFVLRMGFSELALDREAASRVRVRREVGEPAR